MTKSRAVTDKISILFTCIGRRVSLLNSFRRAGRQLKINLSLLGTDATELSSALQLCDKGFTVRPTTHASYIKQLLNIVRTNHVKLLIPTVDLDLKLLAQNKSKFATAGCRVLVSKPNVVDICQDKRKTFRFLLKNGFDTPVTISPRAALSKKKLSWPCFLKPWDGSASKGNAVVSNREELSVFAKRIPKTICQEFIEGTEYTCDVYVDFDMEVRCVVPRKRIETRAGEVSKGQAVKDSRIMSEAARLVKVLGAGPGVITLQLFLTNNGEIKFVEINPRFGGGVPLSIKAGANFPKWILQEILGKKTIISFNGFKDNLIMLRYDSEIWLEKPLRKKVRK
ncbi:MAG: ATP-grasp domain-containing protein [Phycisphaerae bacterium]|nr:ATP-grasp domain-containing protein [Phycisphaerae bacterium]MDD5381437.1 ATP-grasp domain-containing protein [Phycisphaerae bacterium]